MNGMVVAGIALSNNIAGTDFLFQIPQIWKQKWFPFSKISYSIGKLFTPKNEVLSRILTPKLWKHKNFLMTFVPSKQRGFWHLTSEGFSARLLFVAKPLKVGNYNVFEDFEVAFSTISIYFAEGFGLPAPKNKQVGANHLWVKVIPFLLSKMWFQNVRGFWD